jgi:cytochrome c oxidase subunit 2
LGLQDAASPVIEEFIFFHDFAIRVLVGVTFFVGVIMALMLVNKRVRLSILEGQIIECV